jgi:hypothetical protein
MMPVNGEPRRKHSVVRVSGGTRIEIEQPFEPGPGVWRLDLTVERIDDVVDLRISDNRVAVLTLREARDLAVALGRAAGGERAAPPGRGSGAGDQQVRQDDWARAATQDAPPASEFTARAR